MLQGLKTAVQEFWMALRGIAPPLPPLGSSMTSTDERRRALIDRQLFHLDAKAYKHFTAALDKSPAANAKLRQLLVDRAPWDQ